MRQLTVALLGPSEPFRGGIVHYTRLLRAELERRHRVTFVPFSRHYPRLLYPGIPAPAAPRAAEDAGEAGAIDWLNPLTWERVAQRLRRLDPDVVIVPWWTTFWAPVYWWLLRRLRATTRVRILFVCHNVIPHEHTALDRAIARRVLALGTDHFAHSEDEARRLRRVLLSLDARVRVVPHPSYASFNTRRHGRDEARKRLAVTGEMILFFGFVRPYKGLTHLLRAMAEPVLARRGAILFVVGEFWDDRASADALIATLGVADTVRVTDRYVSEDEMELHFAACDVVALPYTSVTGSGAAQLAAGFRRPIVASALGDLTDVVRDGVTGYLVPPADHVALAAALARGLDERERLQRNVDSATDERTWARFVDRVEETLAESGSDPHG